MAQQQEADCFSEIPIGFTPNAIQFGSKGYLILPVRSVLETKLLTLFSNVCECKIDCMFLFCKCM